MSMNAYCIEILKDLSKSKHNKFIPLVHNFPQWFDETCYLEYQKAMKLLHSNGMIDIMIPHEIGVDDEDQLIENAKILPKGRFFIQS